MKTFEQICAQLSCGYGLTEAQIEDRVKNPKWDNYFIHRCHNWCNYIPAWLQESWFEFPQESRAVFVVMAEDQASHEQWE